jgi:hypothetical protein
LDFLSSYRSSGRNHWNAASTNTNRRAGEITRCYTQAVVPGGGPRPEREHEPKNRGEITGVEGAWALRRQATIDETRGAAGDAEEERAPHRHLTRFSNSCSRPLPRRSRRKSEVVYFRARENTGREFYLLARSGIQGTQSQLSDSLLTVSSICNGYSNNVSREKLPIVTAICYL